MKSNIFTTLAFIGALLLSSCGSNSEKPAESDNTENTATNNYIIDANNSNLGWDGTMLGIYTHTGTIQINNGTIVLNNGVLTGGEITVDMNSITPTDENYNEAEGKTKDKLVGHLSSEDFFDVQNYPTATFTINSVDGNIALGTLTVRGISNEEKITDIVISETEGNLTANGKLTFDRKKYNIAWDSPMKEMVLSNDVNLNIAITAKAQ